MASAAPQETPPVSLKDLAAMGRDPTPEELSHNFVQPGDKVIEGGTIDPTTYEAKFPLPLPFHLLPKEPKVPSDAVRLYSERIGLSGVRVHVTGADQKGQSYDYYTQVTAARVIYGRAADGKLVMAISDPSNKTGTIEIPAEEGKDLISGLDVTGKLIEAALKEKNPLLADGLQEARNYMVSQHPTTRAVRELLCTGMSPPDVSLRLHSPTPPTKA